MKSEGEYAHDAIGISREWVLENSFYNTDIFLSISFLFFNVLRARKNGEKIALQEWSS